LQLASYTKPGRKGAAFAPIPLLRHDLRVSTREVARSRGTARFGCDLGVPPRGDREPRHVRPAGVAPRRGGAPHLAAAPLVGLAACLAGYLASDFTSGLVHWIADTWGSRETPIVGRALIGPFREHHLDPEAITRHDFVETNGASCLISIPVAILALAVPLGPGPLQHGRLFAATFLGALVVWTFGTNQFHKWAHADSVPRVVARLQKWRLILPPALHGRHHRSPYTDDYCITSG
jgi:ubiquitin-conjugating enzyme E2 variant